jgi:uncharacterized membrane protein
VKQGTWKLPGLRRLPLMRTWSLGDLTLPLVAFGALRAYAAGLAPLYEADTPGYEVLDFLGAERLWTVPLLYTALPIDTLRVIAQLAIGIAAWSLLAIAVHRAVEHRVLAWIGTVIVLLLGLMPQVTKWDAIQMSESLSISLLVALVAGLLLVAGRQPSPRQLAAVLGVMTLWVFTRQVNAAVLLVLLPFLLVWCARRLRGRRAVAVAVTLALVAAWGGLASSREEQISRYNALQILENRIVPRPDDLRFFTDRGLPTPPALFEDAGAFPGWPGSRLFYDGEFMGWINEHWRTTYLSFLLQHPLETVSRPLREAPEFLSNDPILPRRPVASRPVVPEPIEGLLWDDDPGDLPLWIALAACAVVLARRRRVFPRSWEVPALLLSMAAVSGFVTWHSAAGDLARLFIPTALMMRLALLLLLLLAADAWQRDRMALEAPSLAAESRRASAAAVTQARVTP